MNFFLNVVLPWLPVVFFAGIFLYVAVRYLWYPRRIRYVPLIAGVVSFRIFYAIFLSGTQYYVWLQNEFTKLLLPPYQPISYFLFYSWGRFWLNAMIILGVSLVFWLFLRSLAVWKKDSFRKSEAGLGLLMALIVGWPHVVIFVPLSFVLAAIISLARLIFFGKSSVTLGTSFLLAALILFVWGDGLIELFNLGVLRI
ncbi:MAG: hypothetical protein BMS9Abin13_105 [Patescibacteria group bacterium]|nr:MAG: hypothetical protein BMS9Abin13_105 [Patescibacteria group bacterium]